MYEYQCKLVRVIDADTVVLDVDLGWNVWLTKQHCRLRGINAPERYTEEGKRATEYMHAIVGQEMVITTDVDKTGSFKRMLVTLFRDGLNINEELVRAGHAVIRE